MAYPYRAYDEDEDEDMEDMDLALAAAIAESENLDKAIQNSLESFTQQHGNTSQGPGDTVEVLKDTREVHGDTRDLEVPSVRFTAEEIAQDDLRRERELYGPPTPPLGPRILAPLSPTADVCTPSSANTIAANIIAYIVDMVKYRAKKSANDVRKGPEEECVMEDKPTAKGAFSVANTKSDPLTDENLTVKMVRLLGTIYCPPGNAPWGTQSNILGSEDAVDREEARPAFIGLDDAVASAADEDGWSSPSSSMAGIAGSVSDSNQGSPAQPQAADMPGKISSQGPASSQAVNSTGSAAEQVVMGMVNKTVADDNEAVSVGGSARLEGSFSPVDDLVDLDVTHDATEPERVGHQFDNMLARDQVSRVAAIEAALDAAAQVASDQNAPTVASPGGVGEPAGDEELEWFLDEPLGSPRSGSEQMKSPHQKSQAQ